MPNLKPREWRETLGDEHENVFRCHSQYRPSSDLRSLIIEILIDHGDLLILDEEEMFCVLEGGKLLLESEGIYQKEEATMDETRRVYFDGRLVYEEEIIPDLDLATTYFEFKCYEPGEWEKDLQELYEMLEAAAKN